MISLGLFVMFTALFTGCTASTAQSNEYTLCQPLPQEARLAADCHVENPLPLARAQISKPWTIPSPNKKPVITIIIDPGHGGEDLGAQSKTKPIYSEKNFNLVTARFLQENLEQMGYRTAMTRVKDVFIPLDKRAAAAHDRQSELFISVHYNAAESEEAQGVEVFYFDQKEDPSRTLASKTLAQSVLKELLAATNAKSRGVKHGNYHVIRESNAPAILIEGGFLTNPDELLRLKDPLYLKKLAWGIAQGVSKYLGPSPGLERNRS